MEIKEKQKILILAAVLGIAAFIFYYNLLLKPQFLKFIVMNREFGVIKARLKNAETMILNKDKIAMQYDSLVRDTQALGGQLPGQDEISSLLGDFSSIAESSGVKILKIKPLEVLDAAQSGGFYSEFPILIEASAGYHQFGVFINKVESMDRFIRIDDIDIRGSVTDARRHYIKLRVATYLLQ